MKNHFEISRFWFLLRLELFKARKGLVLLFVITFGMLFFVGFLLDILVETTRIFDSHEVNYASSLLIGGFVLSSLAFSDLGNPLKRLQFLTLPVSTLERVLCMWLLTSIGWVLFFTITYTLYTLALNPIGHMIFKFIKIKSFDPFNDFSISAIKYYMILQGIFLMGAAYFRGYVLPKVMFTLVIVAFSFGVLVFISLKDIFMSEHSCKGFECELVTEIGSHQIWVILKSLFWYVLAPLTWVLTYLGIREQEA